jgi:hypothetical protein
MRITSAGRVGIGTTSPASALHISTAAPAIRLTDTDGDGDFAEIYTNLTGDLVLSADHANGNANSYIGFHVDGDEKSRIDSSGRLLVGTSSTSGSDHLLQVRSDSGRCAEFFTANASAAVGPYANFSRSKGSAGSPTVVANNDRLGTLLFNGYSGAASAYRNAAEISAFVDGEPDTSGDTTDMPGRLVFATTADGASSPTERMRINNAGAVLVGATTPVGSETLRVGGTVHALNLPVTANGVFNATDSVYEVSTAGAALSSQFGKFQGRINPSNVADSTIAVRFLMDASISASAGNCCILKLYDTLIHSNAGSFDIKEQHYHFLFKMSGTSNLVFPVTPAYSDSATGQSNESATMTLSNPTFRGATQGAPTYVQFDLALGSGRTNPRHVVCYEFLVLRTSD